MNAKHILFPECAPGAGSWVGPTVWGLAAGLTAGADTVLFALFQHLPLALRLAMIVPPIALAIGYVGCVVGMYRRVDELQRKIQLESLGFAFPATAILVMAVDLLEQARILPVVHVGWGFLVLAMCLLWMAGYAMASRRYQ